MGASLPSAVECTVVERNGGESFHIGAAEINGWRPSMEDAHIVHMKEDWGFFGVFDGHGGGACSKFVAQRIQELLDSNGCPEDDAAVKSLILGVDQDFLDTHQPSGSTATMCIVHKPAAAGDKHRLRVINAGDSRVLLGRRDGTIVDGGGTDFGLTTDHKPDHPSERERIYRCGGTVEVTACARVNGDLAVSRGFGDASHKETGGPGPEDRPVTANPELGRFDCDEADFILLVCDGVSEGNFSNSEVVELVAATLKETNDPGEASRRVIHKALATDSKDNVTCMCVMLTKGEAEGKVVEFIPGPLNPGHKGFMTAYEAMADRAGKSMAQAAELRYEQIQNQLAVGDASESPAEDTILRAELAKIGNPDGAKASDERAEWFKMRVEEWKQDQGQDSEPGGPSSVLMRQLMGRPELQNALFSMTRGQGAPEAEGRRRRVRVCDLPTLQSAVEKNPGMSWKPAMTDFADAVGEVITDDDTDGTSKVLFSDLEGKFAWIPTVALEDLD